MLVEPEVLARLEWDRVHEMIAATSARHGPRAARGARPLRDPEAIVASQERIAEMRTARAGIGRLPITEVEHPAPVLAELQVAGKVLLGRDIYETVRMLSVARQTVRALEALDP